MNLWIYLSMVISVHVIHGLPDADNGLRTVNSGMPPPDDNLRECECWRWDQCVSNCSANPVLKDLLQVEHRYLSTLQTPFVIVFPYQARKNKPRYDTSTLTKRGTYFLQTEFWLHLLGRKHVQLKLETSNILGQDYSTLYFRKRFDHIREVESDKIKHCHYSGVVASDQQTIDPGSYVAVDTCDGIRGILSYRNKTYGVAPLSCPQCLGRMPHVVYPAKEVPIDRNVKLNTFWRPYDVIPNAGDIGQLSEKTEFALKVGVIIDDGIFSSFNGNVEKSVQYAARIINFAVKSFIKTQIRISLGHVEVWNLGNRITLSSSIKTTLNGLVRYRLSSPSPTSSNAAAPSVRPATDQSTAQRQRVDATLLLTTQRFTEDVEYLAVPDSVCTPRSSAVVQVTHIGSEYHISRLVSLAIAEHFGIKSFPCPDLYRCDTKEILSAGDQSRLKLALLSGMANCLVDIKPGQPRSASDTCGNGKLDRGEECDPGSGSVSACCDKISCLASPWAQCVSGECCANCTLLPAGRICNPARDECDLPEFCSGDMGGCPTDLHLENGRPCRGGSALCYQGRCPSRDAQCEALWGRGARVSSNNCYTSFNLGAKDSCGSRKCRKPDVKCGVLHCAGGRDKLNSEMTGGSGQLFINYIVSGDKRVQCKSLAADSPKRYVLDGTQCAPKKFCFDNKCVSSHNALQSLCPTVPGANVSCSNRGVCTNIGRCLCRPEWTGSACEIQANSSDPISGFIWMYLQGLSGKGVLPDIMDSSEKNVGPKESALTTVNLIIILAGVVLVVFFFLAFFMICYRRRSAARQLNRGTTENSSSRKHMKRRHDNGSHKKGFLNGFGGGGRDEEDLAEDSMERMIKFGTMPSYREDKLLKATLNTSVPSVANGSAGHMIPSTFSCAIQGEGAYPASVGSHSDPAMVTQANLLMENSWRHPEKGILKNKSDLDSETPTYAERTRLSAGRLQELDQAQGHARKLSGPALLTGLGDTLRSSQSSISTCGSSLTSARCRSPDLSAAPPVILCNAANQTDTPARSSNHSTGNHGDEDDDVDGCGECMCADDDAMTDCQEPDCQECRAAAVEEHRMAQLDRRRSPPPPPMPPTSLPASKILDSQGRTFLASSSPSTVAPKFFQGHRPTGHGIPGVDATSEDGLCAGQTSETEVDAHFLAGSGSPASSANSTHAQRALMPGRGGFQGQTHPFKGGNGTPGGHTVPGRGLTHPSSTPSPPNLQQQQPQYYSRQGVASRQPLANHIYAQQQPTNGYEVLPHVATNGSGQNRLDRVSPPCRDQSVHSDVGGLHNPYGSHQPAMNEVSYYGGPVGSGPYLSEGEEDEVGSTGGNWEGSDTSSLPDVTAGLVNLARLGEASARPGQHFADWQLPRRPEAPPIPPHQQRPSPPPRSQQQLLLGNRRHSDDNGVQPNPDSNSKASSGQASPQLPPPPSGFGSNNATSSTSNSNSTSNNSVVAMGINPLTNPLTNHNADLAELLRYSSAEAQDLATRDEPALRRISYSRATESSESLNTT